MAVVTVPPGYGVYARYNKPNGGTRISANVVGFQNTSAGVASVVIGAVRTAFSAGVAPYRPANMTNTWSWIGDYCLVNNGGVLTSSANTTVVPGTATFAAPAPNVSADIKKSTNLAGRQYRGRISYPAGFLDETTIDEVGNISNTVVGILTTNFNTLLSNMSTAGVPMVLIHRAPLSGITPLPTPVTALIVESLAGNQRKRLRK